MSTCLKFASGYLTQLITTLLFSLNAYAVPLHLGPDIPFYTLEDKGGSLTIEQFSRIPDTELKKSEHIRSMGYSDSAFWFRFSLPRELLHSQDYWIELGPNFLDHLSFYYRETGSNAPWTKREAGDLSSEPRGDIDYRFPVFILPAQSTSNHFKPKGYDIAIRVKSTSAVVLNASVWSPEEFSSHASFTSSLWGFYSGLVFVSSALAFLLAILLRRRLFWSIFLFSLTSILVACIEGFFAWFWGSPGLFLQHYLTSILSLLGYTSLLWMCTEAISIKQRFPRINKLLMLTIATNLLMQASIPLGLYGWAVTAQGIILPTSAIIFTCTAFLVWKRGTHQPLDLIAGLSPLVYLTGAMLALLCLYGLIPFEDTVYVVWKFTLLVNLILVLWLATSKILKEKKQAQEQALLEQELRLERSASRQQRQFIGIVSHEFRTPLSIISATLHNLQLMPCEPQVETRYDKIQRATDRLVQLTDNCLADARLEDAMVSLQADTINLSSLLLEVSSTIEHSDDHQLQISLNGQRISSGDYIPAISLQADRALLRIALSNLIDNAIKYSPSGEIKIGVGQSSEVINISIEDEGPGIPADQTDVIFNRYQRLPSAIDSPQTGTGLGLYVARQIARAHQGDLQLTTSSPQGCRFEITLPL